MDVTTALAPFHRERQKKQIKHYSWLQKTSFLWHRICIYQSQSKGNTMSINKIILSLFLISSGAFEASDRVPSRREIKTHFSPYLCHGELPKKSPDKMTRKKFKKLATQIAKHVDTSKADIWVSGEANENGHLTYTRDQKKGEQRGWLALRPGDVIYYEGAMGIKEAQHMGIYIGQGCTVEKWRCPKTDSSENGVVVLNVIEHFKTSSTSLKSLYKPWTFLPCFREQNRLKKINLLKHEDISKLYEKKTQSRRKIITNAAHSIGRRDYALFADNCQSFCSDHLTGVQTRSYQLEQLRYEYFGYIGYDKSIFLVLLLSRLLATGM